MKVKLECSEKNRSILENLLLSEGIIPDDDATVLFKEDSRVEVENPLCLSFKKDDPTSLLSFLSQIKTTGDLKEIEDQTKQSEEILLGRNGECFEVMKISEICYIYSEGDFVFCRNKTGSFEVKKKLYQLEEDLRKRGFIRIGKSLIINILMISEVVPWFGGRLLLRIDSLKDKVEVSRSYVKSFKSYLGM